MSLEETTFKDARVEGTADDLILEQLRPLLRKLYGKHLNDELWLTYIPDRINSNAKKDSEEKYVKTKKLLDDCDTNRSRLKVELASRGRPSQAGRPARSGNNQAANPGPSSHSGPNTSRSKRLRAQAASFIPASIHQADLTSRQDASHHEQRLDDDASTTVNAPLRAGSPRNTNLPHSASPSTANNNSSLALNRGRQADSTSSLSRNIAASAEDESLSDAGHTSNGSHSSTPHPAKPADGHGSIRSNGSVQLVAHTHTQSTTSTSSSGSKRKLSQSLTSCWTAAVRHATPNHTPSASVNGRSHQLRNGNGEDDAGVQCPPKKRRVDNVAAHYASQLADGPEFMEAAGAAIARRVAQCQTNRGTDKDATEPKQTSIVGQPRNDYDQISSHQQQNGKLNPRKNWKPRRGGSAATQRYSSPLQLSDANRAPIGTRHQRYPQASPAAVEHHISPSTVVSASPQPARAVLGSQNGTQPTGGFQSLDGVLASTVINDDNTGTTTNNNDVSVHNPSEEERAAFEQERRAAAARLDQERRAERARQDEISAYASKPSWARDSYNTGGPTYEDYIA